MTRVVFFIATLTASSASASDWTKAVDLSAPPGVRIIDGASLTELCKKPRPKVANFCKAVTTSDFTQWDGLIPSLATLEARGGYEAAAVTTGRPINTLVAAGPGAIDQTAVLYGAADFFVGRARLELQGWLLEDFFDRLCETGTVGKPRGGDLLPKTCAAVHGGLSPLAGGMPMLREELRRDIQGMPRSLLLGFLGDPQLDPATRDALVVAIVLAGAAEDAVRGSSPELALAAWASNAGFDELPEAGMLRGALALRFVSTFLAAMNRSAGEIVVPATHQELVPALMAAAVSFADRHCVALGGEKSSEGCKFALVVGTQSEVAAAIEGRCRAALELLRRYANAVDTIEKMKVEKSPEDYLRDSKLRLQLIAAFETAVGVIADFADFGVLSFEALTASMKAKIPDDVRLQIRNARGVIADMRVAIAAIASARTDQLVSALISLTTEHMKGVRLPPEAIRAVSFATEISAASDSESARAALDAFAAPLGSYKRKREKGERRFWINGHVGLMAGGETPFSDIEDRRTAFAAGPTVQVGPEIVYWRSRCVFGYYGLFFPLLDLGALASWREAGNDEEIESRPNVGIDQVFSPGAYLTFGFRNAPVTLGVGGSLVPRLRKQVIGIDADDKPIKRDLDMIRFGVACSIDIPVFP